MVKPEEYTTNPYGFKCPLCGFDDIFDCIDCGALTCHTCGHVWGKRVVTVTTTESDAEPGVRRSARRVN